MVTIIVIVELVYVHDEYNCCLKWNAGYLKNLCHYQFVCNVGKEYSYQRCVLVIVQVAVEGILMSVSFSKKQKKIVFTHQSLVWDNIWKSN